ncbi:Uncharacterized protein FKW44_024003, partial [Caligus rogercresseyi]
EKENHNILLEIQSHPEFINAEKQRASVELKVLDVNDNAPKFDQKQYFGIIHTDSEAGTPVMQVKAFDVDSGPMEGFNIIFKQNNLAHHIFEMDPKSGIITSSLRLKDFNGSLELPFHFLVIAQDESMKSPLQSTAYINILDIDANDLVLTLQRESQEFEPLRDDLTSVLETLNWL